MDFVLIWVDNQDPNWQTDFEKYSYEYNGEKKEVRFRDWGNLRYWFRSVEKFTPWVNKIHFVTCGHYPSWLNKKSPKLHLVKHSDYIPEEFLPTFNANPIELNLHHIKGLSEEFVYFNDDMFILQPLSEKRFFSHGKPRDMAALNAYGGDGISAIVMNDLEIINRHFPQRQTIKRCWNKFFAPCYGHWVFRTLCLLPWPKFTGFCLAHMPQPFLKSTFEEVWSRESDVLTETCRSRFRQKDNVNQYLFQHWQLCSGMFIPYNTKKNTQLILLDDRNLNDTISIIKNQSKEMITINDTEQISDFNKTKQDIIDAFQSILPDKSSFEL